MSSFIGEIYRKQNSDTIRVKVPLLHGGVKDADLPEAYIASSAGITPDLKHGTKVLVSFGNNNVDMPYVFGILQSNTVDCAVSANFTDLEVKTSVTLPSKISIKDENENTSISWENIKCLSGLKSNVSTTFSGIKSSIDTIDKTLKSYTNVFDNVKDGVLNDINKLSFKNTSDNSIYGTSLPKTASEGQIFFLLDKEG